MGRAYSACLGCLALGGTIVSGLIDYSTPEAILLRGLYILPPFMLVGYLAGYAADHAVRHSVEMDFRRRVLQMRQKNETPEDAIERMGNSAKAGN